MTVARARKKKTRKPKEIVCPYIPIYCTDDADCNSCKVKRHSVKEVVE